MFLRLNHIRLLSPEKSGEILKFILLIAGKHEFLPPFILELQRYVGPEDEEKFKQVMNKINGNSDLLVQLDRKIERYETNVSGLNSFLNLRELILKRDYLTSIMAINAESYLLSGLISSYNTRLWKEFVAQDLEAFILFFTYQGKISKYIPFVTKKLTAAKYTLLEVPSTDTIDEEDDSEDTSSGKTDQLYMSDSRPFKKSQQTETIAYWRCRWLLSFIYFSNQDYIDCCKNFVDMLQSEPLQGISAIEVFNDHWQNDIVSKNDVLQMIILSMLVAQPINEIFVVISMDKFQLVFSKQPELHNFLEHFTNAAFQSCNKIWSEEWLRYFQLDLFISKKIDRLSLLFRFRQYLIYLSMVQRASTLHLATRLAIDEPQLKLEILQLIHLLGLNFQFDYETSTISYVCIENQNQNELLDELIKTTNEIDDDLRGVEVGTMVYNSLPL
ncbi:hypothetical protein LJB42_001923 [Komagataella kurtzmanii]|nr:hypothetical protein LJB42_001923 [Komagataella kurtzmanii]